MATYSELFGLSADVPLLNRITAAVAVQAEVIRIELDSTPNHANRLIWAQGAFSDPVTTARRMMWAILAQNAAATVEQIQAATDEQILAAVAGAVDVFAVGV